MNGTHPYRYIDSINSQKHLLLLYEDLGYAKILEFRFINNGISNNQPSVYVMHDDIKQIEEKMRNFGIDVTSAKRKRLLYIYQIPDLRDHPKRFMEVAQDILSMITNGLNKYRLVCRLINEIDSIAASYHKIFHKLDCMLLCSYYISEIPGHVQKEWLKDVLENHHGVIFAPKLDSGIAFDI